jgi:hypothetical protein
MILAQNAIQVPGALLGKIMEVGRTLFRKPMKDNPWQPHQSSVSTQVRPGMQFKHSGCVRFFGDSSTECHAITWSAFWQDFGAAAETLREPMKDNPWQPHQSSVYTHQRPGMQFKLSVCVRFSSDSSPECHENTLTAFCKIFDLGWSLLEKPMKDNAWQPNQSSV